MPRRKREQREQEEQARTGSDGSTPARRRRAKRRPLGVPVSKMEVPHRKGYVRRWINDKDNRIRLAQEAGYEFVTDVSLSSAAQVGDDGSKVNQVVGTKDDGTPLIAYLMEIPQDWHNEDQEAKMEAVDKTDEAIREGNVEGHVGQDGRYIPNTGITLTTKSRG